MAARNLDSSLMPNIASVIKDEISRVARREIKAETEALKKVSRRYRSDIAELKRQIALLERQVARLGKPTRAKAAPEPNADGPKLRFRADGLKKHRERLGLSATDAAKLIGVSAITLYNWESGKTRPRAGQLGKIAAFRKLGKREAGAQLG